MMVEIIRKITKTEGSKDVMGEQVLAWTDRVETQKAQSAIINSLNETKDFDLMRTARKGQIKN